MLNYVILFLNIAIFYQIGYDRVFYPQHIYL